MDVDICIDAYTEMSDLIFQKVAHRVTLSGKVQARFDSERLTSGKEISQAETLTQQALTMSRARHGNQHPVTLRLEIVASEILKNTGEYESATQLATHAYSLRRETRHSILWQPYIRHAKTISQPRRSSSRLWKGLEKSMDLTTSSP